MLENLAFLAQEAGENRNTHEWSQLWHSCGQEYFRSTENINTQQEPLPLPLGAAEVKSRGRDFSTGNLGSRLCSAVVNV